MKVGQHDVLLLYSEICLINLIGGGRGCYSDAFCILVLQGKFFLLLVP